MIDLEVLEAAGRGEDWALEAVYQELAAPVLGYLRGQGVRDPEDAASEVFVGVVRGLERFRGDERDFRTWVFSIAHRRAIDERRRLSRRREEPVDPVELTGPLASARTGDVEEEGLDRLGARWAVEALGKLSPDQRAVVSLRVLADLSVEQVAAVLGKSPGAVKTLQRRGLAALARNLERQGVS